jgi:hypothetical protein
MQAKISIEVENEGNTFILNNANLPTGAHVIIKGNSNKHNQMFILQDTPLTPNSTVTIEGVSNSNSFFHKPIIASAREIAQISNFKKTIESLLHGLDSNENLEASNIRNNFNKIKNRPKEEVSETLRNRTKFDEYKKTLDDMATRLQVISNASISSELTQ